MLHYLRSLPTNIDVVLLGDLNTPDINWLSMVGHSRFSIQLCTEFFKSNLTQLISQPTHIHGNLLDIVATNASHRIFNIEIDSYTSKGISDHFLVFFNLKQVLPKIAPLSTHLSFDLKRADLQSLHNYLLDHLALTHPPNSTNTDLSWSTFHSVILKACNCMFHQEGISSTPSPRSEIRHMLNQAHTLKRSLKNPFKF